MASTLVHRGPDFEGCYLDDRVGLVMRRLSIIDLEGGTQPVANEDESVWAVFNGEIYNYRELRRELIGKGHVFSSQSDTETIVHLYEEHQDRLVDKLRGMFALAVWDRRRGTLMLARDRFGIKPLYYFEGDGRLVFASELKAILQLPDVPRRLNWTAVTHLFASMTTPADCAIVAGVHKLEPGCVLVAPLDRPARVRRYWEFRIRPDYTKSERYFTEGVRERLLDAVRSHLVSDVPVGAFLSGGVDSSSVVAMMNRAGAGRIKTFSIGFREPAYDERPHARAVAEALGTEHHELEVSPDLPRLMEDLVWFLDEPFGDVSVVPTYLVSEMASRHVKVVLSGDGGDEIFAGYDRYVVEERERTRDGLPRALRLALAAITRLMPQGVRGRNFLRHLSLEGPERYLDAVTLFRLEQQRRLFRDDVLRDVGADPREAARTLLRRPEDHWLASLQTFDVNRYLPLDILTKVDRMSMAHSLETRVPLLDHVFVEFAATIPPEWNFGNGTTKRIFKEAMRPVLPAAVLRRRKQGFAVPLEYWFRGELQGFVRDVLLSDTTRRRGLFDLRYVDRLLRLHRRGRELDLHLWTMISFELWCRRFLDSPARPSLAASELRRAVAH